MKKYALLLAVLLSLPVFVTGCADGGGVLRIGTLANVTGEWEPFWNAAQGDREVMSFTEGYATVVMDKDGNLIPDPQVVLSLSEEQDETGCRVYTVTLAEDLYFSDGTPITAEHYAAWLLLFASHVSAECGATGEAGIHLLGWEEYRTGRDDAFAGVRVPDQYTLVLRTSPAYADNYYGLWTAMVRPLPIHEWLPDDISVISTDAGAKFSGDFTYSHCGNAILRARKDADDRVSAGAYRIASYDPQMHKTVLSKNEYYKGTYDGTKPTLDEIVYRQVTPSAMFSLLRTGELDVLHGITGAQAIDAALGMEDTGHYQAIRYDNNGYTALQFRCDIGPAAYAEVRRGIAYLTDREQLVEEMLGEYGETVNAPYSQTLRDYDPLSAFEDEYLVDYEPDTERAVYCFESAGFILGEDGQPYQSGIRCRALREGERASARCFTAGDVTLMPLIIDWCTYEDSADAEYIRLFLTETEAAQEAGISFVCTELPYEEYLTAMRGIGAETKSGGESNTGSDLRGEPVMFDMYRFFGRVYDFSGVFSDRPVLQNAGINQSRITDSMLADSAMRTVYGITPGETEKHLDGLFAFADRYNELVPELPLYASVTVDLFSTKIHGYGGSMSSVAQAVMKCSVGK